MNTMSFPYDLRYMLPICEIRVLGRYARIPARVLIDSGAEYTILPSSIAVDAGLDVPPQPNFRIQYGGSQSQGFKIRTYFEIGSDILNADIVYVEEPPQFPYGLLGRKGVFNRYNEVAFSERTRNRAVEFRG